MICNLEDLGNATIQLRGLFGGTAVKLCLLNYNYHLVMTNIAMETHHFK